MIILTALNIMKSVNIKQEEWSRMPMHLHLVSHIYHPDKHNLSDEEAVEFFQHLNNAHSYLREIM